MIKNDRQYKYTKKYLVFLTKELELMKKKYPMDKDKIKFLSRGRCEHITKLEKELKDYEDIKKNPFPGSSKIDELYKISQNLARFRIARGITQKQMARKLGCKQSDISRLEREGYCGYSINQLYKITNALNLKIEIKLIPKEILIERKELVAEEFPDIFRHRLPISNTSYEESWYFWYSRLNEFISLANENKKMPSEEEPEKIFSLA